MTDDPIEDLPSPVAWASARAAPMEGPNASNATAAARAFVELAVVRVLSEALGAPRALPFTVEGAMRLTMLDEMDSGRWIDLFASLETSGLNELLGLPTDLPSALRDAMDALGVAELVDWLQQAPSREPESIAPAINALTRAARGLYELPLHYIRRVTDDPDGATIEYRRLVGTAWPAIRRSRQPGPSPVRAGTVVFWDGETAVIPVPDWLLRWDERRMTLWLYAGRHVTTGQWRFESWFGVGDASMRAPHQPQPQQRFVVLVSDGECIPPPFFTNPAQSPSDPWLDDNAQTGMITRNDHARARRMAAQDGEGNVLTRSPSILDTQISASPFARPEITHPQHQDRPPDGALALRVLTGTDLMRYVILEPDIPVVLGRNAGTATFVLHHHQVSRSHTEVLLDQDGNVTVTDLGSTNGTMVSSRALSRGQRIRIAPGTLINVGPVGLRLEWLTPVHRARLDEILDLGRDVDTRDPHTQLLHPTAVTDTLPRSLRPSFRDGGTARHAPSLWGILLYVDRLAAIHAQHGERIADRVFRDVARVLQYEVDFPGHWTRVGYGELLLPCVGLDDEWVRREAERLLDVIASHPWEQPIERLTASAAISRKEPAEPAQEWLKRLRSELRERRPREVR